MSRWIPLYGKHGTGKFMLVDDEDFDLLNQFRWFGYIDLSGMVRPQMTLRPERLVLPFKDGFETDHKNGDPLDFRKDNLRYATHRQNMQNRRRRKSKEKVKRNYIGVNYRGEKHEKPWAASINHSGKKMHLGHFASEREAAECYDLATKAFFGKDARTNFPKPETRAHG